MKYGYFSLFLVLVILAGCKLSLGDRSEETNEEELEFIEDGGEAEDDYNVGGAGTKGKGYGESCNNKSEQCDPELWLSCVDGNCGCTLDQVSVIDDFDGPAKSFCVARAGAKCEGKRKPYSSRSRTRRQTRSLSSFFGIRLSTGSSNYYPNMNCVENAECDGELCVCHPDFYRNSNGSCVKKKFMFQKCFADDQCQKSESLVCVQGKCRCVAPLIAERNSHGDRKCVIPVGGRCNEIMGLVKDENGYNINDNDCVRNADCYGRVCECNVNFRVTTEKTCGGDYGAACSKEQPCSDIQFVCRDGTCQCRYGAHQYYDQDKKQCLSLANGPCNNPINSHNMNSTRYADSSSLIKSQWGKNKPKYFLGKCSPNSICVTNGYFNECICKSGYAENTNGECIKTFGAVCERDTDCDVYLACVNGVCKCPDVLQQYSPEARRCVGLVGSRCSRSGFGHNAISASSKGIMALVPGSGGSAATHYSTHSAEDTPALCVQNSSCVQTVKRIHGKCICNVGFEPTGNNRTCRLVMDSPSTASAPPFYGIKSETKNSTLLLT